jgi:hypothetical protein
MKGKDKRNRRKDSKKNVYKIYNLYKEKIEDKAKSKKHALISSKIYKDIQEHQNGF